MRATSEPVVPAVPSVGSGARTLRVLNLMGAALSERLRAELPELEIVDVPAGAASPELAGDVLLAWHGPASAVELARRTPWVHVYGTGVDWLPEECFDGRLLTCGRGASAIPIAEFVLAAMLAFEKRLPEVWIENAAGWRSRELGTLHGRRLALLGLGAIGVEVARRALSFGMEVVALRRRAEQAPLAGVATVSRLPELLEDADHLALVAPATPQTRRILDRRALADVKPGLHLVNVARGSLVDLPALRSALDDGRIAAATLDATDPEPLPAGHWLYTHPRVRLSPHTSAVGGVSRLAAERIAIENLRRFQLGEPLVGVVDPAERY
jgi:phosphoglycerate dehydrogenase-like enzyme